MYGLGGGQPDLSFDALSISKIVITKSPPMPSFTLSPSSVNTTCGTALAQTFTVNNVYNTPGVTSYSWNLGSANNGWLYNGNPAPQNISTAANTLALTKVACGGSVPQNINASALIGSTNYNTNTSVVSNSNPVFSISGGNTICNLSTTYSIANVPCNGSVSWLSSDPAIASVPPTGNPVTVTKNGSGVITLTAQVTSACTGTVNLQQSITLGTLSIPGIIAQQASGTCYYNAAVILSAPATAVEFSINNLNWTQGIQNGNTYKYGNLFQGPGSQLVYARTSNSCGKGPVFSKNLSIPAPPPRCQASPVLKNNDTSEIEKSNRRFYNYFPCSKKYFHQLCFKRDDRNGDITIYPNPANRELIIETPALSNNEWVSIYDVNGKLMHKEKISSTKILLNISFYNAGLYLIKVEVDGRLIKTAKIMKQ